MKEKEALTNQEGTLNDGNLNDLSLADDQAGSTKGGENYQGQIHIESFSFGVTQGGGFVR